MGGKKNYFGAKHRDCLMFDPSVLKVRSDPQRPDGVSIDETMVWSIIQHGVIEPLVISRDGDEVYVEAGRRRRAHAIEANKRRPGEEPILVPCVWARGDEGDLAEKAVIENFQRQSPSAIGTAKAMQHLLNLGRDEERLRQVFGFKSIASVRGYLALLDCAPEVQRFVEAGGSAAIAVKLSKLSRAEQKEAIAEMQEKGVTKGAAAHRAVKDKTDGKPVVERVRMRSRRILERVFAELEHPDTMEGSAAACLLGWILGDDNAFAKGAGPHVEIHNAAIAALKRKRNGKDSGEAKHEEGQGSVGVSAGRKTEAQARSQNGHS